MTTVLTTSDPHIAHAIVAADRGFSCTKDHDDFFAQQWVENVTKKDTVWILGDLASSNPKPALELLAKLPGTKHLVTGNHDPVHALYTDAHRHFRKYLGVFSSVQMAASRRIGDRTVLLSHFPYEGDGVAKEDRYSQWRLRDEGLWLLHGHVHKAWKVQGRQVNVGFDAWERPVSFDELGQFINACEEVDHELIGAQ
ncbi:metallophosphoesterase family protein [Arthrobacter methylotrophus]|uniref:Metallophosphoesterase n=1 Tax=Arthrobacter methylotrophus TaxID=121291 RepID=A0ABV5UNJ2_9MICC